MRSFNQFQPIYDNPWLSMSRFNIDRQRQTRARIKNKELIIRMHRNTFRFVAHITETRFARESRRRAIPRAAASPVDDTVMNIASAGILSRRDER
jgi:hypothetical protein